uniref:efflux RND transporter permease subunit n=1 Tax=Desulfosarcina sp. TaxID=2027861 RepID=UPI003562D013
MNQAIQKKVNEAELYLKQGLFANAHQIYSQLIKDSRAYLKSHPDLKASVRQALDACIEAFEVRCEEIQRQSGSFERNHEVGDGGVIPSDSANEAQVGAVLEALGIYDEAIDEPTTPAQKNISHPSKPSKPPFFSFDTVCSYPLVFLVVSCIFAAVFAVYNPSVKTVNNVDYFKLEHDADRAFYEQFKTVFGNDEFFIIAFDADPLFSQPYLSLLDRITRDLEAIEEIESVTSLANVDDIIGESDYFEVRKFLEEITDDPEVLASLRAQAVNNYLYVNNLLPKDARTAAIVVEAYDRPEDEDYRQRLLSATDQVLKKYQAEVPAFYLGGWTTTNFSLSQYLKADMMVFVPATYLLIALTTWLFFRNVRLTLLTVINISVCLAATRGLLGLTGITLNNVTSIVIPLVMALSLCDTVHIFSHLDKSILKKYPEKNKALAQVLKKVALPCFLTTLTTAVGFLSLSFSDIVPIKEFAWVASAGMVFEFIFSFFLLPPLLLCFQPETIYRENGSRKGVRKIIEGLGKAVRRHHRPIAVMSCLVVILSVGSASLVRVETNLIDFFKKSSPVRKSLDFVEKRLSGVGTLDVSFKADTMDAFKLPANLRLIESVQQFIDSVEHVDKTMSFVDFLKDMNASFHDENIRYYKIPSSAEMVSQYMLVYDSDDIDDFVNGDYDHARISVRISEHSSSGQKRIVEQIKAYIATIDHSSIDIRVTGRAVIDSNLIDAMVKGQITSLSTAAL